MKCVNCKNKDCYKGKDCFNLKEKIKEIYEKDEKLKEMMKVATSIEGEFYCKKNRLEEIIEFCRRMNYKKIGIAFCIGLSHEAKILSQILENAGFEVYSICCKVCGISKDEFNLKKIIEEREEAMCNPVGQAYILNEKKTDLNIICGLCIGHDIIFTRYSKAPVTTFIVKDRVLGHNPAIALYCEYIKKRINQE